MLVHLIFFESDTSHCAHNKNKITTLFLKIKLAGIFIGADTVYHQPKQIMIRLREVCAYLIDIVFVSVVFDSTIIFQCRRRKKYIFAGKFVC